jgi:hypothetical protein
MNNNSTCQKQIKFPYWALFPPFCSLWTFALTLASCTGCPSGNSIIFPLAWCGGCECSIAQLPNSFNPHIAQCRRRCLKGTDFFTGFPWQNLEVHLALFVLCCSLHKTSNQFVDWFLQRLIDGRKKRLLTRQIIKSAHGQMHGYHFLKVFS